MPSPSATPAQAGAKLALPSLLTSCPAHYFLPHLLLIPVGGTWPSISVHSLPPRLSWLLRVALEQLGQPARSLCGPQRGRGRRASAGVGGTGKSAQSPEERMASSPSKRVRRQFHFLQSQLPLFKACRFGSYRDSASDFVELASQRGLWERVPDGSPLYLKRAGHQGKGRNSGLHDLWSCVPSVLA